MTSAHNHVVLLQSLDKIESKAHYSVVVQVRKKHQLQVGCLLKKREEFPSQRESFVNVPDVLWFTATSGKVSDYNLLSLHPVELARQITLLVSACNVR